MKIVDVASSGNVTWFKPGEFKGKHDAFLLVAQQYEPQRPTQYGPRDTMWVSMIGFNADGSHVDYGKTALGNIGLVNPLKNLAPGDGAIQSLGQYVNKKGNEVWCWNSVKDEAVLGVIGKFIESYTPPTDDDADDAPDFEDEDDAPDFD